MSLPLLLSARECLSSNTAASAAEYHQHPHRHSAAAAATPSATAAALRRRLARGLRLSRTRRLLAPFFAATITTTTTPTTSAQPQALLWLDLDAAESRHLLVTTAGGGVALYDVARLGGPSGREHAAPPLAAVASAAGGASAPTTTGAHRAAASGCCWYPVDSGALVTCGHDGRVVVWDTNALVPAAEFSMLALRGGGRGGGSGAARAPLPSISSDVVAANAVAMSPIAAQHCLVAAAAGDGTVRLCDAASGAVAHTLGGGGGGGARASAAAAGTTTTTTNPTTIALAWSRLSEYELAAGDALGRVLVWDVRRAGPRAALDSRDTDVAAQAAAAAAAAAAGGSAGSAAAAPSSFSTADPWSCRAHGAPVLAVHAAGPGAAGGPGDGLLLTAGRDGRVAAWAPRAPHRRVVAHFSGAGAGAALSRHRWDVGPSQPLQQQQQQVGVEDPAQQQQQQQQQASVGAVGAARGLRLASDDAAGLLFAPAGRAVYVYGMGPLPDDYDRGGSAAAATLRPSLLMRPRRSVPPPPPLGESVAALREGHYAACAAVCWNPAAAELYSAGLDGALLVWAAEDDDDGDDDQEKEEEEGGGNGNGNGIRRRDDDWARGRVLLHERRREQRQRGRRRYPSTPAWLGLGGGGGGGDADAAAARARAREARRRRPAASDRDDWSTTSSSSSDGGEGSD